LGWNGHSYYGKTKSIALLILLIVKLEHLFLSPFPP
jgi:hypothetical protein